MIDIETFKKDNFIHTSEFFQKYFLPQIKLITPNDSQKSITFKLNLDDKFQNPMKNIHGGASGFLVENFSNGCLMYFNKIHYYTLEITLNYVNAIKSYEDFDLKVILLKSTGATVFVNVEISNSEGVLVHGSMIKSKNPVKF